jgi:Tol biopolymer transport system component
MSIGPFKVVLAGMLLAVVMAVLLLTLVAAEKPAEAAFPGKNGKIAFVRDGGIWTVNPDGSDQTFLSAGGAPAWSPDGSKIVFERSEDVWTMNADGSNQINLTNHPEIDADPAWSPDGSEIVFVSNRHWPYNQPYGTDLYIMNADGSDPTRVPHNNISHDPWGNVWYRNAAPAWSPNGTKIVFEMHFETIHLDYLAYLYSVDVDGSDLASISDTFAYDPAWSPDGAKIAFTQTGLFGDEKGSIYIMNADGSNRTEFNSPSALNYDPAWSPDGSKIAFVFYEGYQEGDNNYDVVVTNADGSNPTNITNSPTSEYDPDWQPLPGPTLPTTKAECKSGGYKDFDFKNQGRCVANVQRAANRQ